jgi:hypothetical protein
MVEEVLLAVADELVEEAARLVLLTEGTVAAGSVGPAVPFS